MARQKGWYCASMAILLTMMMFDQISAQHGKTYSVVVEVSNSMSDKLNELVTKTNTFLSPAAATNFYENFVIIPFNRTSVISPSTVTTDASVFRTRIADLATTAAALDPVVDPSCGSASLRAVIDALYASMEESHIFVITNSQASDDPADLDMVKNLAAVKRSRVTFLVPSGCGSTSDAGYTVYKEIAQSTGGEMMKFGLNPFKTLISKWSEKYVPDDTNPDLFPTNLLSYDSPDSFVSSFVVRVAPGCTGLTISISSTSSITLSVSGAVSVLSLKNKLFVSKFGAVSGPVTFNVIVATAWTLRVTAGCPFYFRPSFVEQPAADSPEILHAAPSFSVAGGGMDYMPPVIGSTVSMVIEAYGDLTSVSYTSFKVNTLRVGQLHEIDFSKHNDTHYISASTFVVPSDLTQIQVFGEASGAEFRQYSYVPLRGDVDECADESDNCDENAQCSNTGIGFDCTCNDGYEGDGVTCIAVTTTTTTTAQPTTTTAQPTTTTAQPTTTTSQPTTTTAQPTTTTGQPTTTTIQPTTTTAQPTTTTGQPTTTTIQPTTTTAQPTTTTAQPTTTTTAQPTTTTAQPTTTTIQPTTTTAQPTTTTAQPTTTTAQPTTTTAQPTTTTAQPTTTTAQPTTTTGQPTTTTIQPTTTTAQPTTTTAQPTTTTAQPTTTTAQPTTTTAQPTTTTAQPTTTTAQPTTTTAQPTTTTAQPTTTTIQPTTTTTQPTTTTTQPTTTTTSKTSTSTHPSTTSRVSTTTRRSTTRHSTTTRRSTTRHPTTTRRPTTRHPTTTRRSTTRHPTTTRRPTTRHPTTTRRSTTTKRPTTRRPTTKRPITPCHRKRSRYNATACEMSSEFCGVVQMNNLPCPGGLYVDGLSRHPDNRDGRIPAMPSLIYRSCCITKGLGQFPNPYPPRRFI